LQPVEAFRSGKFNKVPVINGSNHDEGTLFVAFGQPLSAENYPAAIASFAHPPATGAPSSSPDSDGQKVVAEYPLERYGSASEGLAAVLGDAIFSCSIQKTNQLLSAFVPAYEYEFNDRNAPSTLIAHPPFSLGAYHTAEIPYIFQTYFPARTRADQLILSAAQTRLSDEMAGYWSSFIKTEKPDGVAQAWSPEKRGEMRILSLAPGGIRYESDFLRIHHCALWTSLRPEPEL
jgi:para-nitrobenzyl esterase